MSAGTSAAIVRCAMSQQSPPPANHGSRPQGDPWHAFGFLATGVAVYGLLGWLADRWLGTSYLVVIGILLGAVLGLYMTFARFGGRAGDTDPTKG